MRILFLVKKILTVLDTKAIPEEVLKQDDKIDQIYSSLFAILENDSFSKSQAEEMINILFILYLYIPILFCSFIRSHSYSKL